MKHLQEFSSSPPTRILATVVAFLLIDQTSSLSTEVKLSRTESNIIRNGKSAVIVGGGPTGLAASLMLEKCGWSDITIIERRSTAFFESSKAYLYLIDGRGQKCSNLLGLTTKISERGVSSLLYPGLNEVMPTGIINTKKLPVMDKKTNEKYWIPRSEFLDCFLEDIKDSSNIKVLFSSSCDKIELDQDGKVVLSIGSEMDGVPVKKMTPDLLLGCDGINSIVRTWLSETEGKDGKNFDTVALPSAAAGLKYKMLTLQNRFPLPVVDMSEVNKNKAGSEIFPTVSTEPTTPALSRPEEKYVFRSVGQTTNTRINLGLLSVKGDAPRTANIICVPEHDIWKLKTFEEVKAFLVKSFPQIDFPTFVTDEEIARFASATPGEFPKPQYAKGIQQLFAHKKADGSQGVCGVALAGDAVHAFPPDLGQGVNSGLEDVYTLYNELHENDNNLEKALPNYEGKRQPEAEALCKIMQFGYPYQYSQAPNKGKFRLATFGLRLALNKILPFFFSPPAFLLVMNEKDMPYKEILRRVHRTTRNIALSVAAVSISLIWKFAF